jgi:mono/diheme cytochrome c family protein
MNRPIRFCAALLIGAALLTGCGTPRRSAPLTGEHTPPTPEIALGQKVFDAYCHQCHVGGTQAIGLALNNKPLPGFFIRFQVRNGIGQMPSFSEEEIPDEQLDALTDYLVWLRRLDWEPARNNPGAERGPSGPEID